MIEFYAGAWGHYVNHLAPIWEALPAEVRGKFSLIKGSAAEARAKQLGIPYKRFNQYTRDVLVCVASFEDYRATKPASTIFVNHGVGQTYIGADMGSYSGGPGRDRTVAFLCTSERDALANEKTYPGVPAYRVGVPYLDEFSMSSQKLKHINSKTPTVTFSFHANIQACPETRWAVDWVKPALARLVVKDNQAKSALIHNFLAHSHPRAIRQLEPFWKKMGVPFEPDWLKVLAQTDCYVIDNSSSGYEAAAIGIPTVWWNPPYYRRDVHHGLRFWEAIPGVEVNDLEEIESAINLALEMPSWLVEKRDLALSIAYGDANDASLVDGLATHRAVAACLQTHESWISRPAS